MIIQNLKLFCHKNILLSCFIITCLYLLSIYVIFKESPSLKTINLTNIDATFHKHRHNGNFLTTTTTTPTPLNLLLEIATNKNVSQYKKYNAMQAYTLLMKRKIDRLTGKYSKRKRLVDIILEEHRSNECVHIFYTEVIPTTIKNKSSILPDYTRNATVHIVEENLKLANKSGAGVIIYPCLGLSSSLISQISTTHQTLKLLFHLAPAYGIKITLAIKDYYKRNVMSVKKDIGLFLNQYGKEQALFKYNKSGTDYPVIYIMSSHLLSPYDWAEIMKTNGKHSIRQSKQNGLFLGELKDEEHMSHIKRSYFDGFFTTHAPNKVSYGSSWKNWQSISKWAGENEYVWATGILEASVGTAAVGVAFRTALRCQPRPNFVSLLEVPNMNEYFHLSQDYLRVLNNQSLFHV